eukprot:4247956-Amphidinium_carterae.1
MVVVVAVTVFVIVKFGGASKSKPRHCKHYRIKLEAAHNVVTVLHQKGSSINSIFTLWRMNSGSTLEVTAYRQPPRRITAPNEDKRA